TPVLEWTGTPTLTANDFRIELGNGNPNATGTLWTSASSDTRPFQGGSLYLGQPMTAVAQFQFDAQGLASIPIPVTPGMVGREAHYQAVFRDPAAPQPYGLTNALHVDFCP